MSIQVNDFRWEPGNNDAEYIKLLKSSMDEWEKIAHKAITKLKTLSRAQEPRILTVDEAREWDRKNLDEYECTEVDPVYQLWNHDLPVAANGWMDIKSQWSRRNDYSTYGKHWIYLTARPTDEQREAVKWDD